MKQQYADLLLCYLQIGINNSYLFLDKKKRWVQTLQSDVERITDVKHLHIDMKVGSKLLNYNVISTDQIVKYFLYCTIFLIHVYNICCRTRARMRTRT